MPPTRNTPFQSWCFTLNNYNEEERAELESSLNGISLYWICGREIAPGTGTPHLQGYCRLKVRTRFETLKRLLISRIHLESARGSVGQNRQYCSKSGEFNEGGQIPSSSGEGASNSRDASALAFQSDLSDGRREGMVRFAAGNPGVFYFSGFNLLRNWFLLQSPVDRPGVVAYWYYGPPGSGKSRRAHAELPDAFVKEPRTKWWNGYMLEKSVILDDFGPNGIDINHLLRWFDRYKCWVESKGGMLPLYAEKFIVTSNFHPEDVFKSFEALNPQLPALMRRINLVSF